MGDGIGEEGGVEGWEGGTCLVVSRLRTET